MAEGAIQVLYPRLTRGEVYPSAPIVPLPVPAPEAQLQIDEAQELVGAVIEELEGFDVAAFEERYTEDSVVRKCLGQLLGLLSLEEARGHLKDAKQTLLVEEAMQKYESERKKREQGRPFEAQRVLRGQKVDIELSKYVLAKTLMGAVPEV